MSAKEPDPNAAPRVKQAENNPMGRPVPFFEGNAKKRPPPLDLSSAASDDDEDAYEAIIDALCQAVKMAHERFPRLARWNTRLMRAIGEEPPFVLPLAASPAGGGGPHRWTPNALDDEVQPASAVDDDVSRTM